ncbi:MAG: hypothetical protein JNL70_17000 [Saprospiraceae bacterium]|nr:hypothetical protein [Saprospiraceae bacterium]
MKDRITMVFEPQDVADFKAAQETQKRILQKWTKGVLLDNVTAGNAMGTTEGWIYCQDGYKFAIDKPKIYDSEELDIDDYGKKIDGATFLIEAQKGTNDSNNKVGMLLFLVGQDLMDKTHYIRKRGNDKRGINPEYIDYSDKLNALFEKRSLKAAETRRVNEEIKNLKGQLEEAKKTV